MASAQQSKYLSPTSQNDFRLPSLKDLNFSYRSPHALQDSLSQNQNNIGPVEITGPPQDHNPRHVQSSWSRSATGPTSVPSTISPHLHHPQQQQQHTPPLSAGHEMTTPKVEYSTKHVNGGYAHPGIPLSAQVTPVPGSVNIGQSSRGDEPPPQSPSQIKRPRATSANMNMPRDVRASHTAYASPYNSYTPAQPPPTSPYHQIPQSLPPQPHPTHPPPHEQIHHHSVSVSNHPGYAGYQHPYMQSRPSNIHSSHPHQHQPPPQTHNNPYPSPGPPPQAPPPQGPWGQTHQPPSQHNPHHQHQQQLPPPPPSQQQHQHAMHMHTHPQQSAPPPVPPPPHPHPSHLMQQHHHQPPPQSSLSQQQQPSLPPPPPPHQQQQQQHHHHQPHIQPLPPPPSHQSQVPFARTTAIVPTPVESRPPFQAQAHEQEKLQPPRNDTISEIVKHCNALYTFASHYAQMQSSLPHVQPSTAELAEMSQRAVTLVRLLEEFRRMHLPDADRSKVLADAMNTPSDDSRPPKRPWEDISQDDIGVPETSTFPAEPYPPSIDKAQVQTTAEQDMEIIRTKRATSTAGANGTTGQPKSKYRKRSRATPPGKCHSCNIRETPEWRRGPDGARTLCNACGLHYAKLMRKREKNNANGDAPRIDMETLRASARAADLADKNARNAKQQASKSRQSNEPTSPLQATKPHSQHHQGSFQLVTMMAPDNSNTTIPQEASQHTQMQNIPNPGSMAAPPPWVTPAPPSSRGYAPEHLQHQSFMRTSQQTAQAVAR